METAFGVAHAKTSHAGNLRQTRHVPLYTKRLHTPRMSLNVRLTEEEARMAARLRAEGVQISGLAREAIRAEYERRIERRGERSPVAVVRGILADPPDPEDVPPRPFATNDRRAVRGHIEEQLARGRR